MISLRNVSKTFGKETAVRNISLEIAEGETLALLGTSGCGKTTTLRMINRLTEPSGGEIAIRGKDIRNQPAEVLRRGIGYVLQDTGLFPHYTVAENLAIVPKLLGWDKKKITGRAGELLRKLHLPPEEFLEKYPSQLSGGQQQRIGLARALMADPPVLLMDEPFGALDPITRASIQREFKQLDELKRKTIVLVTHDVLEAFGLADRICLMDQGEIKQTGTPKEFLLHPQNAFVSSFLKEQQLQLELRSTLLSEIDSRYADLPGTLSVWDALNQLISREAGAATGQQPGSAAILRDFIKHQIQKNA